MKKEILITLSIILGLIGGTFAQGNLQFNQVVNHFETSSPNFSFVTIGTVPVNKVWKVEFASSSSGYQYLVNGQKLVNITSGSPLWLKEGDIVTGPPYSSCNNCTRNISIIEFNVIP